MKGIYHIEKSFMRNPMHFGDIDLYQIGRIYSDSDTVINPHIHTNLYELTIVTDGVGYISSNNVATPVKRGDIYLSMPCDTHEICSDKTDPLNFDFIAFDSQNEKYKNELTYIMENYHSPYNRVFQDERIRQAVGVAIAELNNDKPFSDDLLSSLFKQILIYLIRDFKKISPDKQLDTVLPAEVICYKLMNYIDTHIYSMKNLQELSDVTGYSYGYLSSLYKKTTSQSLCQYYTKKKADAARLLLLENRFTITEISDLLGFASVYSFSKAFNKHFGRSPRTYRKENETVII